MLQAAACRHGQIRDTLIQLALPEPGDQECLSSCVCVHMFVCVYWHAQEKQTKEALTRKQQKGKKKGQEEESHEAPELLKRPREYVVKFTFPNPPPLSPPILGLHSKTTFSHRLR